MFMKRRIIIGDVQWK